MPKKILITGATGNVGQATIHSLLRYYPEHVEIFAASTNLEKARVQFHEENLKFRYLDFASVESVELALDGIDKILFVRPPQLSDVDQYFNPFLDKVKNSSVKQVVFLSLQGVEKNSFTPHYKIEKLIKEKGLGYIFLRPSFFMQNLTTTMRDEIKNHYEIYVPAGKGKTNFVDVRDIGEVAAQCLAGEKYKNEAFELTGTKSYDYWEIASLISEATGKPIRYKNPSMMAYFIRKKKEGFKNGFILVTLALYTIAKLGKADDYSADLEKLLGKKPTDLETFVEDHKELWL